ncbi:MAG: FAD-dependent oxidoreductase [Gemmatimonadota bacterium]|nr:FAD-dependent oxidoreductase [Gemmatimonadota bacterium]
MTVGEFGNESRVRADVCIVGAGVCGISLARALAARGRDVLLIESGGRAPDQQLQQLNAGKVVGEPYVGLMASRHRQFGGTAQTWNTPVGAGVGAKYVPLDAEDLAGWPLAEAELQGAYADAQEVCGLGSFAYDAAGWGTPGRPVWEGPGDLLQNAVYQFGPAALFTRRYPAELIVSPRVSVLLDATVVRLETRDRSVSGCQVALSGGRRVVVQADQVVLATGGIENARLLLASGFQHDWLGRGFMEHPRDYSLVLHPPNLRALEEARFYDAHAAPDGTILCGRLGVTARGRRVEGLPNASVSIHLRRRGAEPLWRRLLRQVGMVGTWHAGGYGWSRRSQLERDFDAFRLVVNLEQRPSRQNRITLDGGADRFGVQKAVLHYRWTPEEQAGLDRLRGRLAEWFAAGGHGRLEYREGLPPDPNAHHHAGTTRMSEDPADGVVTPSCRVHGVENLYVAGASVFPTAGFANPTLTAVALTLRLADALSAT